MTANYVARGFVAAALAAAVLGVAAGCDSRAAIEKAQAQVDRIAEDLDKRTTDTGSYVRAKEGDVKEMDPWGKQIDVDYSQGGVAETISIRSAGPDREFHTSDDVVALAVSANLKGVGEGIKKNAEETAASAARGVVKGTVEGLKESFQRKRKPAAVEPE